MKQVSFLIFTILSFNFYSFSQTYTSVASSEYESRLIPKTPDVSSLGLYGFNPIDKYTGTANISIPLYQIDFDGLKIPLSVRYNTGGVRVRQEATWIGLGWNLSSGCMITNEVNGFEDTKNGYDSQPFGYIYTKDYLTRNHPTYQLEITTDDEAELVMENQNGYGKDVEPDLFTANLFGKQVKFVLPKLEQGETLIDAISINNPNIKITFDTQTNFFTIIDEIGFKYHFNIIEYGTPATNSFVGGYSSSYQEEDLISDIGDYRFISLYDLEQDRTSWQISKVVSPYGRELFFDYVRGIHMTYPQVSDQISINCNRLYNDSGDPNPLVYDLTNSAEHTGRSYILENVYLSKIYGDFGTIDFNLSNRLDLFTKNALDDLKPPGEPLVYTFEPISENPPKKLSSITIKNVNNKVIKNVSFQHTYFNDDELTNSDKEKYIRLKLDKIIVDDKEYNLQYIQPNDLAPKNSKDVDFWGFFNGIGNTGRIPKYGRFNTSWTGPASGFEFYLRNINDGAIKKSDFNYGKIGLLEKVIYPTGGSTKYAYEAQKVSVKKPQPYIPQFSLNGSFKHSGLKSSSAYRWDYQYLKMANDPSYSFVDYTEGCDISSQSISKDGEFSITELEVCDLDYNFKVTATISCVTGCGQVNPSGPATWIKNVNTGQIINIFYFDGIDSTVNLEYEAMLPVGTYKFEYNNNWTYSSPLVVITNTSYATKYSGTIVDPNLTGNQYEEFEVGGARIISVFEKDSNEQIISQREFNYVFINEDGNSTSSGKLMDELVFHSKNNGYFEYTPEYYYGNSINLHSENILRIKNSASGSHVGYSQVSESEVSLDGLSNGAIQTSFINEPNEYVARFIGNAPAWRDDPSAPTFTYGDVYLNGMLPKSYDYKNGSVLNEIIYDKNENLLKTNTYDYYEHKGVNTYIDDIAYPHISYQIYVIQDPCPVLICGFYPLMSYYKKIEIDDVTGHYFNSLKKVITELNLNNNDIVTSTEYFYEGNGHFMPSKIESTNSKQELLTKRILYPLDLNGYEPFMTNLIAENRLSIPIITESYINKNEDPPTTDVMLSKQTTVYSDLNNDNNLVLPYKVITQKDSISQQEQVLYEQYDDKGNLLQYKKPEGMIVSFIWGYSDQYPVAKVENSTYSAIEGLTEFGNNFAISDSLSTTQENALRTLSNSMVTTYTYDPLVGVTSITDPSGYISYYVYDDFNRLQFIKDKDGVVLKSYKYHYQGQSDPDAIVEYSVTSTTNGNGTVTVPATVNEGEDIQVSITPNTGYEITSIKVNNVVQPISTSFTIENVTSNLIIDVEFSLISNITVSYIIDGGTNGTVSVSPSVVSYGGSTTVTLTPDSGYEVEYVKVGTTNYPVTNNTATITNITADIDVHVSFIALALTVSPTSLSFNFIDGDKTITVTASGPWTVSKSDSWIIISTTTGSGNGTFTVRALKNLGLLRTGNVTVSNGSTTKLISIEQMGDEMY